MEPMRGPPMAAGCLVEEPGFWYIELRFEFANLEFPATPLMLDAPEE